MLHLLGVCGDNYSHLDLLDLGFLLGETSTTQYYKRLFFIYLKCIKEYLREFKIKLITPYINGK
jgi:hypothetical protein